MASSRAWQTPRSVIKALTRRAGVTSKAKSAAGLESGGRSREDRRAMGIRTILPSLLVACLLSAPALPCVAGQEGEQVEFLRGELDALAAAVHLAPLRVEAELAEIL